jgi:acetolactate synthase-1/2/3 large subunit
MSDNNLLNGGQVIIDYLIREKVPYVFGLCGHGNIGITDAMYERAADIKTISVHHESVSGFMAKKDTTAGPPKNVSGLRHVIRSAVRHG